MFKKGDKVVTRHKVKVATSTNDVPAGTIGVVVSVQELTLVKGQSVLVRFGLRSVYLHSSEVRKHNA